MCDYDDSIYERMEMEQDAYQGMYGGMGACDEFGEFGDGSEYDAYEYDDDEEGYDVDDDVGSVLYI